MVAESRGEVLAQVAKAQADRGVQQARMEQVRLQLEADLYQAGRGQQASR